MELAYFLLVFAFHLVSSDRTIYKLCATDYGENCQGLGAGNSMVSCVKVTDSVDCSLKFSNGTADFAIFSAEQAMLASKFINDQVSVIGEVRYGQMINESYSFSGVVVVRANFSGSFADLRDKNYCHPGFGSTYTFTDRILKYFERTVVPMKCDTEISSVEQEVAYVSSFFKSACRPGPWAQDHYLNSRLKRTYPNLCQLCGNPSCSYDTKSTNTEMSTLNCLVNNGDVAFVSYKAVQKFFGLSPGSLMQADPTNYKLLCPDETTMNLSNSQPCTWVRQPWKLIVATNGAAATLQDKLLRWVNVSTPRTPADLWMQPLQRLVLGSTSNVAINTTSPTPIQSYVDRGVDNYHLIGSCKPNVKWCTVGLAEKTKCTWLQNAALSNGIVPKLSCLSARSMWSCLRQIANGDSDVTGIDTEYSYIARRVFNMTTVVYQDSDPAVYFRILAVIKASNAAINSFNDLKFKKACFPEYRGLGWVAYVQTATNLGLFRRLNAQNFFRSACAPGANDRDHILQTTSSTSQNTLCKLCPSSNSSADPCTIDNNPFYGDLGAMQCLSQDVGDVAFIDYSHILAGQASISDGTIDQSKYRVICQNGSLSATTGLNVDDNCALGIGIRGEIVSRNNRSGVNERDVSEMFLQMNDWFGVLGHSFSGVMRMYDRFEGRRDLLFREGTRSVVQKGDNNYEAINSFRNLISNVNDVPPSSASVLLPSFVLFVTAFFLSNL